MDRRFPAALLAAVLGWAGIAVAQVQEPLPPWFERFAAAVRTTLERLEQAVAENTADIARHDEALGNLAAQVYDFHDYTAPRDQTRIYQLSGVGPCSTDTSVLTVTPQADGSTSIREHRQWRTPWGFLCFESVMDLVYGDTELATVAYETPANGQRSTRETGFPLLTRTMRVGSSWGHASPVTRSTGGAGGDVYFASSISTLMGVEDVTVPAGTFTGCLKTSQVLNDAHITNATMFMWWCPGRGLVRQTHVGTAGALGYDRRLVSVQYP